MTPEEYINLLQIARIRENWTEELFKQYQQACIEMDPCIFNELRKSYLRRNIKSLIWHIANISSQGRKEWWNTLRNYTERRQQSSGSKERKNF